jgi:hypothetical protein
MTLERWSQIGWIEPADPTVGEIAGLLKVVNRDLSDSRASGLSIDGRFQHAYDAGLQLCMVALRASGYRVTKGPGHHKNGIGSLRLTLGEDERETMDHLERCSRLRGQTVYERIGVVSPQDARDLLETVEGLRAKVLAWLREQHPDLVPPELRTVQTGPA